MAVILETPDIIPLPRSTPLQDVEAVILAGTYHWNGSAFEDLRARPLLPVAQKPLIEYVLHWLRDSAVGTATICGNGSTGAIRSYVKDGAQFAMDVQYHEDRTPRGAAGCVKDAAMARSARTFVVADGTSIPVVDLGRVLEHHRTTGALLTIVADRREPSDGDSEVLHPAGIYVFDRSVLDAVPATSFQDIKEALIPSLYRAGHRIEVFPVAHPSPRVMNAATYLATNHWMVQRLGCQTPSAGKAGHVMGAPSAWVDPDAIIAGPVMLGAGVRVLAGATIVGPASIGAGTVVQSGAVVARSVVWDDCVIGEGAMVDNAILGDGAVVAERTTVMNTIHLAQGDQGSFARMLAGRSTQLRHPGMVKPAWS
jgi:NDP-sugar pyrophosphorylase family protein